MSHLSLLCSSHPCLDKLSWILQECGRSAVPNGSVWNKKVALTSIWRWFLSVSLNLHASGDTSVGFSAWEIGNVNESVVECRFNVAHAEDVLLVLLVGVHLRRSVISNLLFLLLRLFTLNFGLNTHKHPINHLHKPERETDKINPDSPRDRPTTRHQMR